MLGAIGRPLVLALALVCSPAVGQESATGSGSPLDRLKDRSASTRWQAAKHEWAQGTLKGVESVPARSEPAAHAGPTSPLGSTSPAQAVEALPGESTWTPIAPKTPERPRGLFEIGGTQALSGAPLFERPLRHPWAAGETAEAGPSEDVKTDGPGTDRPLDGQAVPTPYFPTPGGPSSGIDLGTGTNEIKEDWGDSSDGLIFSRQPGETAPPPTFELLGDGHSGPRAINSAQTTPVRVSQVPDVPPAPEPDAGELRDIVFRPITEIEPYYDYSPTGTVPYEYLCPRPQGAPEDPRARCPDLRQLPRIGSTERLFAPIQYQWAASDVFHNPLYFHDAVLERYGQTYPPYIQPFVSVAKVSAQFAGLPYQMAIDAMWAHRYPLGHYRPGEPAPCLTYQVPFNLHAAAVAGGVWTGLIFLFP